MTTKVLRFSEHAAYHRIEAARAARQFPIILELVADGSVTLTTVALLRPHLTPDNHSALLTGARHRSKRDVEHQIACLAPRPDVKPMIRRVPEPSVTTLPEGLTPTQPVQPPAPHVVTSVAPSTRVVVAPVAPDRYLLKVTVRAETHAKLRRAQDLMRHAVPNGDPATIIDRALTLFVDHLERKKFAKATRPRTESKQLTPSRHSRHIPAAVKREVWARDEGRCAFVGPQGRCTETGLLEFHHVVPFADGGPTDVPNIALRCRAHNGFENERWCGWPHPAADGSGPSVGGGASPESPRRAQVGREIRGAALTGATGRTPFTVLISAQNGMKSYVIITGVLFGLVTLAHVWRMFEEPRLATDPWFLSITAITAALGLIAWRVARRAGSK